jgi:hypothetical protein
MRRVITLAIAGLLVAAAPALAAPGQINHRQTREQRRIARGIASGSLTAREGARLERQEARIAAREARARRSGDCFTTRERTRINRELNRESRRIYRQKHDGR